MNLEKITEIILYFYLAGVDQGQCDRLRRRCCLLQGLQRDGLRSQCGQRSPLDEAPGPDNAAKRSWNQAAS